MGGVILEPERPGSRPTSALRINGDRSLQASMSRMPKFEIDMSEYGAKTGPIGPKVVHLHDLGVLKTTSWKMPGPIPAGLLLTLDDVGTSCDMAIAKTFYEAAVRGDAAVVAETCAKLFPPPAEGEEARPKLFPKIEDVYGLQPLSLAAGSGHVEAVVARKYGLCKSKRVKKNKVEYAWARCPDVHRCAMPARLQYIVWPAPSSLL